MTMDWGTAAQWGALLVALIALIRGEFRSQDKDYKDDLKAVDKHFEAVDARVGKLETDMAHLPGKDLVHALQLSMMELKGQMAVVVERVGPIKAVADRMQELLLTEGVRK
jgi:hypothetical protein